MLKNATTFSLFTSNITKLYASLNYGRWYTLVNARSPSVQRITQILNLLNSSDSIRSVIFDTV